MSFSIEQFSDEIKAAMNAASPSDAASRQAAATSYFRSTLEKFSIEEILTVLKDSVPPGAGIGG